MFHSFYLHDFFFHNLQANLQFFDSVVLNLFITCCGNITVKNNYPNDRMESKTIIITVYVLIRMTTSFALTPDITPKAPGVVQDKGGACV